MFCFSLFEAKFRQFCHSGQLLGAIHRITFALRSGCISCACCVTVCVFRVNFIEFFLCETDQLFVGEFRVSNLQFGALLFVPFHEFWLCHLKMEIVQVTDETKGENVQTEIEGLEFSLPFVADVTLSDEPLTVACESVS